MISVGDIVAAKYKVEKMLGKGGMGYVVAARHLQLDQPVAIKILVPELAENEDAVARFLREARASVKIHSDHVVRVLDVGTLDDDGTPFMVMELLEGKDLAKEIEERRKLPVSEAADYLLQVCEGLAHAHALGIVHRDLKPANLFRTTKPDGSDLIKILDFGISKALITEQHDSAPLTSTQGLMGSPHYMSPEQVRKPKTVDQRSDIWSLGVILHEFLAGTPPFASDTPMAILAAVVSDDPPELRSARFDVPETLQKVVSTCLAKDPSRRYADVVELALALKPFAAGTGEASFHRISAILRTAKDRGSSVPKPVLWPSDAPTLESGSAPSTLRDDEKPKNTAAGWGSSQSGVKQTRTRVVATVTAGGALLVFAAAIGYSIRGRSITEETSTSNSGTSIATLPGATAAPPAASTLSAPPIAPAVPAVSAAPAASGTPSTASPATTEPAKPGTEPITAREAGAPSAPVQAQTPPPPKPNVAVASTPKAAAPKRDEKVVSPKAVVDTKPPVVVSPSDPLDGRR